MSEARALTNLIGNGVASVVVAKWCGQLDNEQLQRELANPSRTAVELPLVGEPVATADAARR
ncbi:Aerobic C4-dicarboxylate transport protein [compost metagenome]